jgi:beta-mannosidase
MRNKAILIALAIVMLTFANQMMARPLPSTTNNAQRVITLDGGWQFREAGKADWHAATVPGCVHTDLLSNRLIEDPFYRDNEQKQQWIGKTDWEYQTTFKVGAELLAVRHIELVFEGLDTYADVYLNDRPLIKTDNMFREWRVDCKAFLRAGDNTLRIRFRSPINEILPLMKAMSYELPAVNDQGEKTSPHTRKAPYQYGWDWGPRFVTCGIWKPIRLISWNGARISDLHIEQKAVSRLDARLVAHVEVVAESAMDATISINGSPLRTIGKIEKQVKLAPGLNQIDLDVAIANPQLWWPNGLGEQPLYTISATLGAQGQQLDQTSRRIGIHTLELRQQSDQWGKSFTFVINGVPVFAKGGNWIPADSFPNRVSRERYRQLLQSCKDANMNMLRVWGGGYYEMDDFYDLCDEMGLLVWQDFMFACSMYPASEAFLANVRQEAIDNVKRLRHHPAIVIWVGNNEIETAWQHWGGWKDALPATLWDDYLKIFHGVLPKVVAALDPSRPYWPSSPSSNLEEDPESQRMGDVHYWQVWHASKPFREYEQQLPRFMSEYGFQSFPLLDTVKTYAMPADYDIESAVMKAHQRHPRGNTLVREYMLRDYPEPKAFASFLYVSQVLQAEGIKVGAEHLRRIMPRNMGSLYWQVDDCWPVASWSSMDYYGRWKALQFYARRFYNDLLVSPHEEEGKVAVYVVSDRVNATPARLRVTLMDFDGKALFEKTIDVTVSPLNSKAYVELNKAELMNGRDARRIFLNCELIVEGKPISDNRLFFDSYKNLALAPSKIETNVRDTANGYEITLQADRLARGVYLSLDGIEGEFADNFFDLLPGKSVSVVFKPKQKTSRAALAERLKVMSLAQAF